MGGGAVAATAGIQGVHASRAIPIAAATILLHGDTGCEQAG
jgi:hypothetical protein